MTETDRRWREIERQALRGIGSSCAQALRGLAELAEAHALAGRRDAFDAALQSFLQRHAKRPALMRRLAAAKLV